MREVALRLKGASKWKGSLAPVDAKSDDYVYELACYFRAGLAASGSYEIQVTGYLEPDGSKTKVRWPKKPGLKKNFSFLSLCKHGAEHWQLTPGIKILDRYNRNRTPDIGLLSGGTGDKPTWKNVEACWDAKYSCYETARLQDQFVADFAFAFRALGKPASPTAWQSSVTDDAFKRSGLITNCGPSYEPDAALSDAGICETHHFPSAPLTRP